METGDKNMTEESVLSDNSADENIPDPLESIIL